MSYKLTDKEKLKSTPSMIPLDETSFLTREELMQDLDSTIENIDLAISQSNIKKIKPK